MRVVIKIGTSTLPHPTGHLNIRSTELFCYVNAATRFTDGGEFGLGCEMESSTQRRRSRGPMGLRELNTCKYVILGNDHIR